jgi:protein-arginine kinase activator protein McsA
MFDAQNGQCAICKKVQARTLHVDHCHNSSKVRGLLCQKCNMAIGLFNDNSDLLKKAIKYLSKKGKVK